MNLDVTVENLLAVGEEMRKKIVASASIKDVDENLRKKIVTAATPEERLAGLEPEDRLAGLEPEDRLAGLEPEELPALLQQIDRYLGQQTAATVIALQEKRQTLLRVLRHKFGELPAEIVQRVETATDAEQLNHWLDQAIDTTALTAVNFDVKPTKTTTDM